MPRYAFMPRAALRPAPIASMTVAAPVTMSPPAKTPGQRGGQGVVDRDVAALVERERRGLADDRVGVGADGEHHLVAFDLVLAAGDRHRPGAAGAVGLAQLPCAGSAAAHVAAASPSTSTGAVSQWNAMPSCSA